MNLLFIIGKYPNYGGTEVVTTLLANAFVNKNHKVNIASFEQTVPELLSELDPRVTLHALSFPAFSYKNITELRNIVDKENINVILNQWCLPFYTNVLCRLAINKAKCKIISVLHGVPDKNKRILNCELKINNTENRIRKFLYRIRRKVLIWITRVNLRYVYSKSDNYIVLSNSFISSFKNITGIRNDSKLRCIGNPLTIDSNDFEYIPEAKSKTILYVGRMDYANKRVHRIIEIWELLYRQYPDWDLMLVGDGPEKKTLTKYVDEKNILNVTFNGFQKDPPIEHYKRASVLMLTSELEGFGLVILEGMSFGVVPVVYASYSAVYDIIDNGSSGILIEPPYSKTKMVSELIRLIENPSLLRDIAGRSKEKADIFEISSVVNKWEDLFTDLVTG